MSMGGRKMIRIILSLLARSVALLVFGINELCHRQLMPFVPIRAERQNEFWIQVENETPTKGRQAAIASAINNHYAHYKPARQVGNVSR